MEKHARRRLRATMLPKSSAKANHFSRSSRASSADRVRGPSEPFELQPGVRQTSGRFSIAYSAAGAKPLSRFYSANDFLTFAVSSGASCKTRQKRRFNFGFYDGKCRKKCDPLQKSSQKSDFCSKKAKNTIRRFQIYVEYRN